MHPARIAAWIMAFLVGIVYGVAATISQAFQVGFVPLGLIVAIIGSAALVTAVRILAQDRWSALATGLGLLIATLVFSGEGPGGSVVVPQAPDGVLNTGIVWTIAVPLVIAVVMAWPERLRSHADA